MTLVEYDVVIESLGATPLAVIQLVAQYNQWTLPQSHGFLQPCPQVFREGISQSQALEIAEHLEQAGAEILIKAH